MKLDNLNLAYNISKNQWKENYDFFHVSKLPNFLPFIIPKLMNGLFLIESLIRNGNEESFDNAIKLGNKLLGNSLTEEDVNFCISKGSHFDLNNSTPYGSFIKLIYYIFINFKEYSFIIWEVINNIYNVFIQHSYKNIVLSENEFISLFVSWEDIVNLQKGKI